MILGGALADKRNDKTKRTKLFVGTNALWEFFYPIRNNKNILK